MHISSMRKKYILRFVFRLVALTAGFLLYFLKPSAFDVMNGWNFFKQFSVLHIFWIIWVGDMLAQLIPSKDYISMGAQKLFFTHFRKNKKMSKRLEELKAYIKINNYACVKIAVAWGLLIGAIGALAITGVLKKQELFLITAIFYVCDIICVLFWCPFRVFFLKNRCCMTCRIFNWDHLMMFSPFFFTTGFYSLSLLFLSIVVFLIWEICIFTHPERFWEGTNDTLKCKNCTEQLCGKKHD